MQNDILSYGEMCMREKASLQRGMNYRLHFGHSVVLMSRRANAPYSDRIEDQGTTLIYEGHDLPSTRGGPPPKMADQPEFLPSGKPTQNGHFAKASREFKLGKRLPEKVHVYEKLRTGIWVFNGIFNLVDEWKEPSDSRRVFKFKMVLSDSAEAVAEPKEIELRHERIIPSSVKLEVWKRDQGKCRRCGAADNLHFDHEIPFSKGGSSVTPENIQILCARHNLEKHDNIE